MKPRLPPDSCPPLPAGQLLALILSFAPVFVCPPPLSAQTPPPPRFLVESAPDRLRPGDIWTLSFLVDHPRPDEVEVLPPPFPPALSPGIIRREPRILGTERWTAVEYRFTLRGSGRVILAPFEIISPRGRVLSPPMELDIEAPEGEGDLFSPPLAWENVPSRLAPGKPAELCLRILDRNPGQPLPAPGLLLPEAPEGFILERLRPEPGDGEAGRVLRLRLVALSGTQFRLPPRTLRSGNLLLEIPPLAIPVSGPGASPGEPGPPPPPPPEIAPPPPVIPAPFPGIEAPVPGPAAVPFLRSAYQNILAPLRVLWDRGDRAQALAELRARERYHPAGPLLRPLRRNLEASLGLEDTPDEPWRPRLLFRTGLLGTLGLGALIALRRLFRGGKGGKTPSSGQMRRRAGLALLLVLGGFSLWGLIDGRDLPGGRRSGVLRETAARRIPDSAGTITAVFREGQPVRARSPGGPWVWVEIPDSSPEGGWIPEGDIIFCSY